MTKTAPTKRTLAAGAVVLAAAAAAATFLLGGFGGRPATAAQQRPVADFSRIDLIGVASVTVHVGGRTSVVVRGDVNLLPLISTTVAAGELAISQSGDFDSDRGVQVDVTVPSLTGVTLAGAGDLTVTGVRADRFGVTVSGAGSVGVSGTAAQLEASLTGAGDANLEHLVTRDTRVVVTGTGTATVYATRSLDAVASGPGAVVYHGHPAQVTRTAGGPGTVEAA